MKKAARRSPARPFQIAATESRLADGAPANQVDDCKQDNGAEKRIKERLDRDRLVDAAAEQKAGDDRTDDANDDVQDNALLGVSSHDQARQPADNAANDQPDNYT